MARTVFACICGSCLFCQGKAAAEREASDVRQRIAALERLAAAAKVFIDDLDKGDAHDLPVSIYPLGDEVRKYAMSRAAGAGAQIIPCPGGLHPFSDNPPTLDGVAIILKG